MSTIPTSAYSENRAAFSLEQLLPYEGQGAAFSADGSRVIAADQEIARLLERADAVRIGASGPHGQLPPP